MTMADVKASAVDAAQFRPPRWLRNAHVQTVLASAALRRWLLRDARRRVDSGVQELLIDCGAGVRLQGFLTRQKTLPLARALCVLIHGWEGSANSTYVIDAAATLLAAGCDVCRLNLRDHGSTQHLNRELFHSCRIDEVVGAVRALAARAPGAPLAVIGFSLGGNFALRVALRADDVLSGVLAVCPVISPAAGLFGLEHGLWFYRRYFLHKWRRSLRGKRDAFPDVEWFTRADLARDLRGLTQALVLRHTEFASLDAYLEGYSIAGDRLAPLRVPATILAAVDDPIIPIADFRALQLPPQLELEIATHGGHCGFLGGSFLARFLDARLPRLLGES